MSRFSARAVTALSFAALLLGVAACGPGEEELPPIPTPTTPTPASQTTAAATPTTQAPTPEASPKVDTLRPEIDIPEPKKYPEMANDDLDGADAAARYFLDLYGYVYNTGDLRAWNKISDPECEKCTVVADRVETYYSQGQWFEGFALLHGEGLVYYPTDDAPFYLVTLDVHMPAYEHFDADGSTIEATEEVNYPAYGVGVQFVGPNEWRVIGAATAGSDE